MTTRDDSRPAYAALVWHDGTNLLLQLPNSQHIVKLPFTEGGLHRGLALIRAKCEANGHSTVIAFEKPKTKFKKTRLTEGQVANIKDILRKRGFG